MIINIAKNMCYDRPERTQLGFFYLVQTQQYCCLVNLHMELQLCKKAMHCSRKQSCCLSTDYKIGLKYIYLQVDEQQLSPRPL